MNRDQQETLDWLSRLARSFWDQILHYPILVPVLAGAGIGIYYIIVDKKMGGFWKGYWISGIAIAAGFEFFIPKYPVLGLGVCYGYVIGWPFLWILIKFASFFKGAVVT